MTDLNFTETAFLDAAINENDFTELAQSGFEPGAESFLRSFYADAKENDFLDYNLQDLIVLARDFWMFGNRRKPGERLVNVTASPTPLDAEKRDTAIQVIIDDMAFTVDSLVAAIVSMGLDVYGLFHPMINGMRDEKGRWRDTGEDVAESMILIMVAPQTEQGRARIAAEIHKTLDEVVVATSDFLPMVQRVRACAEELKVSKTKFSKSIIEESVAFLDWIANGNFVLFGVRRYDFKPGKDKHVDYVTPSVDHEQSLGILKDPNLAVLRQSSEPTIISKNVQRFFNDSPPITVAKSNLVTRVHRRVRMDYISLKHFGKQGQVEGETRFVGLFTAEAYNRSPNYVPLIRQKVQRIKEEVGGDEESHNVKRLEFVLSSYPRDELFQIEHEDLLRISTGVAKAFDRPRTRIFVRRDRFERFVSVLVYVPRENYNARVRERIGNRLKDAFGGRISAFYPHYDDSALARVHFIIGLDPDEGKHPDIDALEADVAAIAQPWHDGIIHAAEEKHAELSIDVRSKYIKAFSIAYTDKFTPLEALSDISCIETLNEDTPTAIRVRDVSDLKNGIFKVKLYSWNQRFEPSDVMPVMTNFNCHVVDETAYPIVFSDTETVWVNDYEIRLPSGIDEGEKFSHIFETAFLATWHGKNEDDGFNKLILPQGADWREIAFLRLVARYRRQSGLDPSEATQIEALERHPELTGSLIALKTAKFDPAAAPNFDARKDTVDTIFSSIEERLNAVSSLEHDRVLRRMAEVVMAALRTNFYQTIDGEIKPYISLKIASQNLKDLPAPRPYREVYVSSPKVEGVHLRFGPVARGGLRWSDRRDDFRTEVLGLVKAQQVKNAVIVPVGSKGGFFPKALPASGSRSDVQDEAIRAYKIFISGILDLTDNYAGDDTVAPDNVICWDDPDPYLVVAADKGTATFSDIANGLSRDYGFWLDDAFASGGSAGYDHKAMGITARGAWEAVKRHFREKDKDIQSEDFTVLGIGDMSGDVFGNGMLLSKHIKLVAAFNHLDIFIDPDPDAQNSFKERQRMFELPRSTWQDYDTSLISEGGGVFSRSAKSIALTPQIKEMTGLSDDNVTPNQLLHALLKSDVELMWFGGIGTYVKSSDEANSEVGDRANDLIRVNGKDLNAHVIGEGANLGMTQAGRIEFARSGGRVNTDAIDNSAGVDSSDNEVNIKILLGGAIEGGKLARNDRDDLLVKMTDEVAQLVLEHNYDQTGALSLSEMRALKDHNAYERLMLSLERDGLLDRAVEGLPTSEMMLALSAEKKKLTRPEISVLTAYAKNRMFDDLIGTDVADDDYMSRILQAYFPTHLHGYEDAMKGHRLRREIITSRLVNLIVDVCGPTFMMRLEEQTQAARAAIAKGFILAFEILQVAALRDQIRALDNEVKASAQIQLYDEIASVIHRVVAWLVRHDNMDDIQTRIKARYKISDVVDSAWLDMLSPYDKRRAEARIKSFVKAGISQDLATDVALLRSRASGFDVVELAEKTGWSIERSAELFYHIGGRFKIDRIRAALLTTKSDSHWERMALRHLQEDFFKAQGQFSEHAAAWHKAQTGKPPEALAPMITQWMKAEFPRIKTYEDSVNAMSRSGEWTVAKFAIVNAQLSELMAGMS